MGLQTQTNHNQSQQPSPFAPQSRTSSIAQQSQSQSSAQSHTGYPSPHSIASVYPQSASSTTNTTQQDASQLPHYYSHATTSPYNSSQSTTGYPSTDTNEMMAATQMPRHPYPSMSYHQPQGSAPNSVAPSPQHDQHRSIYGQPPTQAMQQPMYYPPQQQYQPMPSQAPPAYGHHTGHTAQHPQHQQPHQQPMSSQPAMMMSHAAPHNPMAQHTQPMVTNSPRNPKMELQTHQMQPKGAPSTGMSSAHSSGSVTPLTPTGSTPQAVNPNAAPGPIPATTPLVVRQDQNGVQWIAFEYSRDRVKMEYTIRCDVESVNTDELSQDFKTENCVYPRACCPKEQYRGNRQVYETECNTVGWALAQLNPTLRGKRGLIQRAVDSWRNSNQDPRLRSRRVRRMAKMNTRKAMQTHAQTQVQVGHLGAGHMPPHSMAAESRESPSSEGPRPAHVFQNQYGSPYPSGTPTNERHSDVSRMAGGLPTGAGPLANDGNENPHDPPDIFPELPEAKKRKFILVEDVARRSRLRVRATLENVDTREIPDSFRKGFSVYPRSYFPREMQSPPPSATGARFFTDDAADDFEDDGISATEGRHHARGGRHSARAERDSKMHVRVHVTASSGSDRDEDVQVCVPRTRKAMRSREVRLNDLGHRMAWLQSRVFAGRPVFLQRALDCYRTKTLTAMELGATETSVSRLYQVRPGKRRWDECLKRIDMDSSKDD